jgi:membrane protease YdiL (CAAX protease family)
VAALGGGAANAAITEMVGGDAAGTAVRVAVTVVSTSVAGVVLCWLRLRSGSLLAPVLAHWTVNGLGGWCLLENLTVSDNPHAI